MWKYRVAYLAFLAAMALFYINYDGWISWFALLITLLMPAFSLICALPAVFRSEISVSGETGLSLGETGDLRYAAVRGRGGYLRVRVTLKRTDLFTGKSLRKMIEPEGEEEYPVSVPTEHCGAYAYEAVRAAALDPLGLFNLPVKRPGKFLVTVYPVPEKPKKEPDLSWVDGGGYVPKPGGGFSELHEMREYRPGDPIRDIHWKLSAKTDSVIIREPQEKRRNTVLIELELDCDRYEVDRRLGQLMWLSARLSEAETPHAVRCGAVYGTVGTGPDIFPLLSEILRTPLSGKRPDSAAESASVRFFIGADGIKGGSV